MSWQRSMPQRLCPQLMKEHMALLKLNRRSIRASQSLTAEDHQFLQPKKTTKDKTQLREIYTKKTTLRVLIQEEGLSLNRRFSSVSSKAHHLMCRQRFCPRATSRGRAVSQLQLRSRSSRFGVTWLQV